MKTLLSIMLIILCVGCSNPIAVVDKGNTDDAVSFLREQMRTADLTDTITFDNVQVNYYNYDWGTDFHIRQEYIIDHGDGLYSGGIKNVHVEYLISTQSYSM